MSYKKSTCFRLSHVQLFLTPWTTAFQALPSMVFSRQEYWSGLPFPSPGNLPHTEIEPASPALTGRFFTTEPPGKPIKRLYQHINSLFIIIFFFLLKIGLLSSLEKVTWFSVNIICLTGPLNWTIEQIKQFVINVLFLAVHMNFTLSSPMPLFHV